MADGRVMIAGAHNYGALFRLNTDGSRDDTFSSPLIAVGGPTPPYAAAYSFGLQTDGKIVFTGYFDTVNGIPRNRIARLNTDGSVDQSFAPSISFDYTTTQVRVLSSGKVLIGTQARLNPNGTIDSTFNAFNSIFSTLDSAERIVYLRLSAGDYYVRRATADGQPDPAFSQAVLGAGSSVSSIASQSDGKVLIGGSFVRMNGVARSMIARVNADGSLDAAFDPGSGFDGAPLAITQQADGKLLIGGSFQRFNGQTQPFLVRLNSNGSRDATFIASVSSTVDFITVQPDGKVLVAGTFSVVNGASRNGLVRLNTDGSTDSTFNLTLGPAMITSVIVQPDTKIVFGGSFSGVNGSPRQNLARVNADGTLDASFNAGSVTNVLHVARKADGTYLWHSSQSVKHIFTDGSADSSYVSPAVDYGIFTFLVVPDGSVIIGGNFTMVGTYARKSIARLGPNGRLDVLFLRSGANAPANVLTMYSDNRFLAGGDFTLIDRSQKVGIARALATTSRVTPFDFDGDGRTDISVTRAGTDYIWYQLLGPNYTFTQRTFGRSGDIVTPADFDGDGITDLAVFRAPLGDWWWRSSATGQQFSTHWGANGDIPLPGDIDGDGKADFVVYRNGIWYRMINGSSSQLNVTFGAPGDKPLLADFDGDGKADPAIFRPSTGTFWYAASSAGGQQRATQWGISTDVPVPADYDGDGKTDFAVYRPAQGAWYVLNSSNGSVFALQFGVAEDRPIPADYDGDGKADIAVYRPSTGIWYLLQSTSGFAGFQWGISTDIPSPAAYIPQ